MAERRHFDGVIIVGAGLAGLSAALAAAPKKALVLTGAPLAYGCSSAWAQGGMAAALGADDHPALHAEDTVQAGAGLVDPIMATLLAEEGPDAVRRLADLGAPFDRTDEGEFAQSLEAAHSRPRVARVKGDQAGRGIMDAVVKAVLSSGHVEVRNGAVLCGLLQELSGAISGVVVQMDGRLIEITGHAVILATGGIGGLYGVTTTPAELLGEGMALAALAGAQIGDPEFVQFHPTAIDIGRDPAPLATEALRGEGAKLINGAGDAFMAAYHPDAELAPRDVVARAIHAERAAGRGAFLDARTAVGDHFPEAFPAVFAACLSGGVDPRLEPIPVVPACHYHMGGIVTDACGATTLPGLFAAGECASTGVHGANRLASNSLVEAAVFGARAGMAAAQKTAVPGKSLKRILLNPLPETSLQALRQAMSQDAGVLRDAEGLLRLLELIDRLDALHGVCGALVAARLVAACALARRESRGGHYRSDYPDQISPARTLITLKGGVMESLAA